MQPRDLDLVSDAGTEVSAFPQRWLPADLLSADDFGESAAAPPAAGLLRAWTRVPLKAADGRFGCRRIKQLGKEFGIEIDVGKGCWQGERYLRVALRGPADKVQQATRECEAWVSPGHTLTFRLVRETGDGDESVPDSP